MAKCPGYPSYVRAGLGSRALKCPRCPFSVGVRGVGIGAIICPAMANITDTLESRPRSDTTLTKPNELLVMVPVAGKLSPVSRKLFNALLLNGGDVYRQRLQSGAPMLAEETFEARLSDLVAHLPGDASDWSSNASAHLLEMLRTEVVWQSIDRNSDTAEWGAMNLLSEASIIKKGRALHVSWAFPPRVLAALKDPAFFTRLDLEVLGSLRSYAAIALYEICSRYKTNPTGVTCSQPPDWWVEALTARSVRPAPQKSRGKNSAHAELEAKPKREWRKVKSESVIDAIEEINTKTDLEIELIEKRVGKAVAEVQFAVRRKRRVLPPGEGVPPDILAKAIALGIPGSEIASIARVVRGGHDVLRAAITKLADRVEREDLIPLSNVTAYLKTILGELDEIVACDPQTTPVSMPRASEKSSVRNVLHSMSETKVVDIVETQQSFARRQIEALPRDEQLALAKVAFEGMKEKGIATASVAQAFGKYLDGGPLAGVLLGEMTRRHIAASTTAQEVEP